MARHTWASDVCTTCKLTRGKTDNGTTWYMRHFGGASYGPRTWTPGPCRIDNGATAEPLAAGSKVRVDTSASASDANDRDVPAMSDTAPASASKAGKSIARIRIKRAEPVAVPAVQDIPIETPGRIVMPGHPLDGMKASLVQTLPNGGYDVRCSEDRGVFAVGAVVECQAGEWRPE